MTNQWKIDPQSNTEQLNEQLNDLIADVLAIPKNQVVPELKYQSVSEWDSLAHIHLMAELENVFKVHIDSELVVELSSVSAIQKYFLGGKDTTFKILAKPNINRGLNGVYLDETAISKVDGQKGQLSYQGYFIEELAQYSSFEEVFYLLMFGVLPNQKELQSFLAEKNSYQNLPESLIQTIKSLKECDPTEVLKIAVDILGAKEKRQDLQKGESIENIQKRAIQLFSLIPLVMANHYHAHTRQEMRQPPSSLSYSERFLYLIHQKIPSQSHSKALDQVLILQAEHSSNASSFVARIAASTQSDFYSAISSAIGVFSGKIHAGALLGVSQMLSEISNPKNASLYIEERLKNGKEIMGFGHRVYKTDDPRSKILRHIAYELSLEKNDWKDFEIIEEILHFMEKYTHLGLAPNVDLYTSVVLKHLGIPQEYLVPIFIMSRLSGWTAHILEQYKNNILIRPLLSYSGKQEQNYLFMNQRK